MKNPAIKFVFFVLMAAALLLTSLLPGA